MHLTKIWKAAAVGLMASTVLVSASAAVTAQTTLTFAHGFTPDMSWGQAAQRFKEVVEEETNGEVEIRIYDSALLVFRV
jgi:TRAP-type C4-dicarboxylate transport system substrate-binding protein